MSRPLHPVKWAIYPEGDRVAICTGSDVGYISPHEASRLGRELIRNAQLIKGGQTFRTKTTEATEQLRALSADLGSEKLIAILAKLAVEETETDKVD